MKIKPCSKFIPIYFYSLYDVLKTETFDAQFLPFQNNKLLNDILEYYSINYSASDYDNELFNNVLNRMSLYGIIKSDEELNDYQLIAKFKNWIYKFTSMLSRTSLYYSPLLSIYDSHINNLMNDLSTSSTSTVKFNDTPQAVNSGGSLETDEFITNVTNSETQSTTPVDTPIQRIKEIQENFRNLINDWTNEFTMLFYNFKATEDFE